VLAGGGLEGSDADPVVRNSEPHVLLGQAVRREEVLEGLGECLGIAELAADDDAWGKRFACDLQQFGGAVVRDARRSELRRTYLQAGYTTFCVATLGLDLRSLLLALLRLLRWLRLPGLFGLRGALGLHLRSLLLALLDRLVALLAAERELLLPERHLRGVLADYRRQVSRGNRRLDDLRRRRSGGPLLARLDGRAPLLAPHRGPPPPR